MMIVNSLFVYAFYKSAVLIVCLGVWRVGLGGGWGGWGECLSGWGDGWVCGSGYVSEYGRVGVFVWGYGVGVDVDWGRGWGSGCVSWGANMFSLISVMPRIYFVSISVPAPVQQESMFKFVINCYVNVPIASCHLIMYEGVLHLDDCKPIVGWVNGRRILKYLYICLLIRGGQGHKHKHKFTGIHVAGLTPIQYIYIYIITVFSIIFQLEG